MILWLIAMEAAPYFGAFLVFGEDIVLLGGVLWIAWYTFKSILQMITHYFNFGTVLYTMYASYAMKMGGPHT